jgi:hydroxymethylpyrimidine/phosphomethylpyrimidine kinase
MTSKKRTKIIKDTIKALQKELLAKVELMPDNWNAFEIQEFIGDKYTEIYKYKSFEQMNKQRYNEYRNYVVLKQL